MQEQCKQSDIRAVSSKPTYWYVDDEGKPEEFAMEGDLIHPHDAEGYSCSECGDDFVSWKAALAHLQTQEVAG